MKVKISKLLTVALLVNMFLPQFVRAESVSMSLYIDGSNVKKEYPIESVDGMYYIYGHDLGYSDFAYTEGDGEITINRYCTEIKITFGSNVILVNGVSQLFTKPVYRTDDRNYISIALIAQIFGDNISVDDTLKRINIALKKQPVLPATKKVSGSISLPSNQAAPASGIAFKVSVRKEIYSDTLYYQYACIEAGQTTCGYSVNIPDKSNYSEYIVQYEILDSYNFPDYVIRGYYTYYGTKSTCGNKILIGSDTRVNLNVIQKVYISGTLNRNGYKGTVEIEAYTGKDYLDSDYVNKSGTFSIGFGSDVKKIWLKYDAFDEINGYIRTGYYTQNGTVPSRRPEDYIIVADANNIQIDIIRARMIKGSITYSDLLNNATDYITVSAENEEGYAVGKSIWKDSGTNTLGFCLNVPYGNNAYTLHFDSNYIRGYLDDDGNVTDDIYWARQFDVSNGDIDGVNINISQPKIYGTVSLPDREAAGIDGVSVMVCVQREDRETDETDIPFSTTVSIPNGENSVNYELPYFVEDYLYRYKVICSTVNSSQYAVLFDDYRYIYSPFMDVELNFSLEKCISVSGTISLPDGMTAQSDYTVTVYGYQKKNFIIPSGSSSCTYSILGPVDGNFKIRYIVNAHPEFLSGYYSDEGTVFDFFDADFINESTQSINNINMTILLAPSVSGVISVPEGIAVPEKGIELMISAFQTKTEFIIPSGQAQYPYTVYVQSQSATEIYLSYEISNKVDGLCSYGYYSPEGVTALSYSYCIPMQNNKSENINFTLMKENKISGDVNLPDGEIAYSDIFGYVTTEMVYESSALSLEQVGTVYNSVENSSEKESGGSGGGSSVPKPIPAACSLLIPSGRNSGTYTAYLPDDALATGYRLTYKLYDNADYFYVGYFSHGGAVSCRSKASAIPMTESNIALTLLKQLFVSGIVTKPEGVNSEFSIIITPFVKYDTVGNIIGFNDAELFFSKDDATMPYSIGIPADADRCTITYCIFGYEGNMLVKEGFYNGGEIVSSMHDAEFFPTTANVTDINFSLKTVETIAGHEIRITDMLDEMGRRRYNIRDSIYDTKYFTVPAINASNLVVEGKIYVTLYGENNKVIETVTQNITIQPWTSERYYMQFKEEPPIDTTKKVKIMVWNDSLKPFGNPFERIFE